MKKRLAITIDEDVLNELEQLPRRVSISEVITWVVKAALQDIKAGRELSAKELQEWIDSTPEGKDFRNRLIEHWGLSFEKIDNSVEKVKKAAKIKQAR
jgi:predicted CopG family antitoxin